MTDLRSRIDHLVVVADTLEQGAQWCADKLGIEPGPGGKHPLMGTHNRLLRVDSPAYPQAYFEIIAIDPQAQSPLRRRWFDMDAEALQRSVRDEPRLAHFVVSTGNAAAAIKTLAQLGIDRGALLRAERPVADLVLRWQITVRDDGQRLFYGALPTLIEWDSAHPSELMPASPLVLQSLVVHHPRTDDLRAAHAAIGLEGVDVEAGAPNLVATFHTPKGMVTIESSGT